MASRRNAGRGRPAARGLAASRELELQVWELFVRGATPQQMAETLGRPLETVRTALERAKQYRAAIDDVETVRAQRLAGLLALKVELVRRLEAPHPVLDRNGDVVYVDEPHPTDPERVRRVPAEDHLVVAALAREYRQLDQRIAALTGSDAASRWEITTPGGLVEVREAKVVGLKERARLIKLQPRPEAIDATSSEVEEQKEA